MQAEKASFFSRPSALLLQDEKMARALWKQTEAGGGGGHTRWFWNYLEWLAFIKAVSDENTVSKIEPGRFASPKFRGHLCSASSHCVSPKLTDPASVNCLVVGCRLIGWENFRTEKLAEHGNLCLQSAHLGGGDRRSRRLRLSPTWIWRQPGLQWRSISKKSTKHI